MMFFGYSTLRQAEVEPDGKWDKVTVQGLVAWKPKGVKGGKSSGEGATTLNFQIFPPLRLMKEIPQAHLVTLTNILSCFFFW